MLPGEPVRPATMMVSTFLLLTKYMCKTSVCESYQKQFKIEVEETVKSAALINNELEDGISYCIDQCNTTHFDSCVGVEMDKANKQ